MTTQRKTTSAKEDDHTQDAVAIILKHEEERKKRAKRKARRKRRRAEREQQETIRQIQRSIDVIRNCVLAISTVMVVSLLIGIIVLMQVRNEVEHVRNEALKIKQKVELKADRLREEVADIQKEAAQIRDKIRHPLETMGGFLGRQLEGNIGNLLGSE